jgi:hypothetical protein
MNCTFNYHPQKEKSRKVFLRAASSNKEISRAVMSRGLAERDIIFFVISILAVYQNKKELIKIYATSTLDSIFLPLKLFLCFVLQRHLVAASVAVLPWRF